MIPHLPLLRQGKPYRSLDVATLGDLRSGEAVAEMSLANPGLIARDLRRVGEARRALGAVPFTKRIEICRRAADYFLRADLAVGEAYASPDDYLRQLAATTGMPITLGRLNMLKVHDVLDRMEELLGGLSRSLDLTVLDRGWGEIEGRFVSYQRQTEALAGVLPNNSPGVHGLWLPSIALGIPVVLKPGGREPWTPYRLAEAFFAAGLPRPAISLYPTSHAGALELVQRTDRSLFFGDASTVERWRHDDRVQVHGPGWSKVLVGDDGCDDLPALLDLTADSVARNGGRSCVNASGLWVPRDGRKIAEALAERLVEIEALPLDAPKARIAAFSDPDTATAIEAWLNQQLEHPGAIDLTAQLRGHGPRVTVDDCAFLLPTVVWCEDPTHPLAETELLFPFVSVVEVPQADQLEAIGPTLVATALTQDPAWIRELMASSKIDRLNVGAIPTPTVAWDQPHEGNLFSHLWQRRSLQLHADARVSA